MINSAPRRETDFKKCRDVPTYMSDLGRSFFADLNFDGFRGLHRPDRVAQLAEHWASNSKVVGSIPTVVRHIFQAWPVWIYTQSNITSIIFS